MRKLLVLVLSAVLVLAVATVSLATITTSGEVRLKYAFNGYTDGDGNDLNDKYDVRLYVDGKVSDSVTSHITLRSKTGAEDFYAYEYWFNVAGGNSALKVGCVESYWAYGDVDIIDAAYDDGLITEAAIHYTYAQDALSFNLWYTPDANDGLAEDYEYQKVDDNAFAIGLGYAGETFGADVNYVDTEVEGEDAGYTVNGYYRPVEPFKTYINYGEEDEKEYTVLGAVYDNNVLKVRGEIGLGDDNDEQWGFYTQYTAANGLIYKYTRSEDDDDTVDDEFRVTVKF